MGIDRRLNAFGLGITKLLLFGAELYFLFVFCNCLFLVPEPYIGMRGLFIAISAVLAAGFALAAGKIWRLVSIGNTTPSGKIFTTFPVVFCIAILSLAALIFALASLGMR
jgi:hypothetical protein